MYVGSAMDYVNLKLLGIYYAVQKVLTDNIAAPMARDLKPIIGMVKDDFSLITTNVLRHTKTKSSEAKLNQYFEQLFVQIDSGAIKPEQFLGHMFSADQTIEQMQMHDSFMALYDGFFEQIDSLEVISSIKSETYYEVKKMQLEKNEVWMFKQMLAKEEQRSPITIDVDELRDIVDFMYEASCKHHGPAMTDKLLSQAVIQSSRKVPNFSADTFL